MKRIISLIVLISVALSLLRIDVNAIDEDNRITGIKYTIGDSTETHMATPTLLGKSYYYAPRSGKDDQHEDYHDVYLVTLPTGARVTDYTMNWNGVGSAVSVTVLGKETSTKNLESITTAGYISGEEFHGATNETFTTSSKYYNDFYQRTYDYKKANNLNLSDTAVEILDEISTDTGISGFAMRINCYGNDTNTCYGRPVVVVQFGESQVGIADKTKLKALLDSLIEEKYYTSDDRYNGKDADTITDRNSGFWKELTAKDGPLTKALAVYNNASATSNKVNAAVIDLTDSIDKLISKDYLNTTELYETIKDLEATYTDFYLSTCTDYSVSAYRTAFAAEWDYFSSLFDETTHAPTDENNAANEAVYQQHLAAASELWQILVSKDVNITQYQTIINGMPALVSAFSANGVRDASASEAYAAARALLDATGNALPDVAQMTGLELRQWTGAYTALQKAAWCIAPTGSVTVTLRVADNYGMRWAGKGLGAEIAVIDRSFTLAAENATLSGLLNTAGLLNPPYSILNPVDEVGDGNASIGQSGMSMLLLNGVNVITTNELDGALGTLGSFNPYSGALGEIKLHSGDEIVLLSYAMSAKPEYSYGISIGPLDYGHDLSMLDVTAPEEAAGGGYYTAQTGAPMTVTVTETGAWLPMYTGIATAVEGIEVMVSEAFETQAEAQAAVLSTARIPNPESTPLGWTVVYTLSSSPYYDPDWLLGDALLTDASGEASILFLEPGWYKVAVMDTRDADSTQPLGSDGKYYSVKASDYILVEVTPGNIENVRQAYIEQAQTYFEGFHDYDFPDGYYEETFEPQYESLMEHLTSATVESAMTAQFNEDWALLQEYGATAYDHQGQVDAIRSILRNIPDDLSSLDSGYASALAEIQTQYAAMSAHAKSLLTESELNKLAAIAALDLSTLRQLPSVTIRIETQGSLPLRNDGGNPDYGSANVAWAITPGLDGMISEPEWRTLDNLTSLNVTGGDHAYVRRYLNTTEEQYRLMWSVDDGATWNSATPQILTTSDGAVSYDGYFLVDYSVPRDLANGSTVTILLNMWSREEYDTGDVDAAKQAATAEVQAVYDDFDLAQYDDDGKAALQTALNEALAAINAATGMSEVKQARNAGVAAMGAVPTKNGDTVNSSYNSGTTVGKVYVEIENTTYDSALSGTLAKGWYPLGENDSMMTVALKVLEDNGYSWYGTGGTNGGENDYTITYLAGITRGDQTLAQFTGGSQSGWMGTLNDWFVNEGFNMFSVANGKLTNNDEIHIMYTLSTGADIGGDWGNKDTSLSDLNISDGTLSPAFKGSTTEYTLDVPVEGICIMVHPDPVNKNYQSRIYLNNYNRDSSFYKPTDVMFVKPGDVIYIGVGDQGWPTMNNGGQLTKYQISVVCTESAGGVEQLISAIGTVTYSNYEEKQAAVDLARSAYDALAEEEQAKVGNYADLEAAEKAIQNFEKVDDLKAKIAALPDAVTTANADAVTAANSVYNDLSDAYKALLTSAETNKLLKAVNTLTLIDAVKDIPGTKDFKHTEVNTKAGVISALQAMFADEEYSVNVTLANSDFTGATKAANGSYSATITFTLGKGEAAAVQTKNIGGVIQYVKSSNAGVTGFKVKGVSATGSDASWAVTLPYGSKLADLTAEDFEVAREDANAEVTEVKKTAEDGSGWSITVTAEDGTTTKTYQLTLSVSKVQVTVLDSAVYSVTPDVEVESLSPVAVSGLLEAVSVDALGLDDGTKSIFLWLKVTATAKDGDDVTLRLEPMYAVAGEEEQAVPAAAIIGDYAVTLPINGTSYTRILFNKDYLEAEVGDSTIRFKARTPGEYTVIPDAHIASVIFHLCGGDSDDVKDGEEIVYYREDADKKDLPIAVISGGSFEGWYDAESGGKKYTAVSADMPKELYARWSFGVNVIELDDVKNEINVTSSVTENVATITVDANKPCVVVVKSGESYERLTTKGENPDGSYSFEKKGYTADMIFYVAVLGDFDKDGDLDKADFTAANKAILNSEEIDTLQLLVMGANGKKLKTVDLAKLYLALASGKVEW